MKSKGNYSYDGLSNTAVKQVLKIQLALHSNSLDVQTHLSNK